MGYRSDVAFKIQGAADCLSELLANHPLTKLRELGASADHFHLSDTTIEFHCDWIKWYDECPEVQEVSALLEAVDLMEGRPIGAVFLRVGDDFSDAEAQYFNWPYVSDQRFFEMAIERTISTPFPRRALEGQHA